MPTLLDRVVAVFSALGLLGLKKWNAKYLLWTPASSVSGPAPRTRFHHYCTCLCLLVLTSCDLPLLLVARVSPASLTSAPGLRPVHAAIAESIACPLPHSPSPLACSSTTSPTLPRHTTLRPLLAFQEISLQLTTAAFLLSSLPPPSNPVVEFAIGMRPEDHHISGRDTSVTDIDLQTRSHL